MIKLGNYIIQEYPNLNKLVVNLPQTMDTVMSTTIPVECRKKELTTKELTTILAVVKAMYDGNIEV